MTFELGGVAVVTGAGGGIGRAIAARLAEGGADVVCADRDPAGAREAVQAVEAAGARALAVEVDVADSASVEALAAAAAALGPVAYLVNCAGLSRRGPALETTDEDWRAVVGVNLDGLFWCCRAFGRSMAANGGGRIVNISSTGGMAGWTGSIAYSASKGAVVALTRSLAKELAEFGITVNAVAPGPVETPMMQLFRDSRPDAHAVLLDHLAFKEFADPMHVAAGVHYLCSPEARLVTGVTLPVDSGYLTH